MSQMEEELNRNREKDKKNSLKSLSRVAAAEDDVGVTGGREYHK